MLVLEYQRNAYTSPLLSSMYCDILYFKTEQGAVYLHIKNSIEQICHRNRSEYFKASIETMLLHSAVHVYKESYVSS